MEKHEFKLVVDDQFVQALNQLSSQTNSTNVEVIRNALNFYNNAVKEWDNGKTIVFVSRNKNKFQRFIDRHYPTILICWMVLIILPVFSLLSYWLILALI